MSRLVEYIRRDASLNIDTQFQNDRRGNRSSETRPKIEPTAEIPRTLRQGSAQYS